MKLKTFLEKHFLKISNFDDRIVQEAKRVILNAIYQAYSKKFKQILV